MIIHHKDWSRGEPRILAQKCPADHAWYLPRLRCPNCGGDPTSFEPRETGTVLALTSLRRRTVDTTDALRIALVDLDDGVRLMTRASESVEIGSRVAVSAEKIGPDQSLLPNCEVLSA